MRHRFLGCGLTTEPHWSSESAVAALLCRRSPKLHGQRRRKKLAVLVTGSVRTNWLLVTSGTALVNGVQSGGALRDNVASTVQFWFVGQRNTI